MNISNVDKYKMLTNPEEKDLLNYAEYRVFLNEKKDELTRKIDVLQLDIDKYEDEMVYIKLVLAIDAKRRGEVLPFTIPDNAPDKKKKKK
jgi:predicted site-specific integrase-resolvase